MGGCCRATTLFGWTTRPVVPPLAAEFCTFLGLFEFAGLENLAVDEVVNEVARNSCLFVFSSLFIVLQSNVAWRSYLKDSVVSAGSFLFVAVCIMPTCV